MPDWAPGTRVEWTPNDAAQRDYGEIIRGTVADSPIMRELDRVLLPRGQAVLLVSDWAALKEASAGVGWKLMKQFVLRILGQRATLTLWQK